MNMQLKHACAALALSVLLAGGARAADGSEADIVGLTLGMTVAEAEAAIKAYNPDLHIQPPVQKIYQYRVGNKTHKTDPFVSYIFAVSGKKQHDSIYVYFSLPPSEPRAIAISRIHNNFDPPISREAYIEALHEKYGPPQASEIDATNDNKRQTHRYQWLIGDGKVQCLRAIPGGYKVDGPYGSVGASTGAIESGRILPAIQNSTTGKMIAPDATSPDDCAVLLTYSLAYDPLGSAKGVLVDVAAAARSEAGVAAWIDSLVQNRQPPAKPASGKPKL
ncbi:MAG: hypothetical protein KDC18_06910 [Alphaproteobacteria bacterium]|nr:hypothetical protein [Alphaproteobacteria bacterium]MCB9930261.1 hypothetical protein [Alphaproteobacteria bacterium]